MRSIQMSGPPRAERAAVVKVGAVPVHETLPAGVRLLDALASFLDRQQVESACLTLTGGSFGPFGYVIPALSPDPLHPAYYSDTFRPAGDTALEVAAITVGFRHGEPFFHSHGIWTAADGTRGGGHILPDDTHIAAPIAAHGAGIVGARFEVTPDPETGFSLFMPCPTGTAIPPGAREAIAFRLAPNQDAITALERLATAAGFRRAILRGGVASIIGARFIDAPEIEGFATEMLVRHCVVQCADAVRPETELDIVIVDLHGNIGAGYLVRGDNPVLITFEGLLEAA